MTAGPVYPYRDRRFDHEEWPSLERSELRAANHHVLYGGAMVISAYPFVITADVATDLYSDFAATDLRERAAKRNAESGWPGPMYGDFHEDDKIICRTKRVDGRGI